MKSSAAVYNRLEIAAKRLDRRPLYDWLMRRTNNAVRDVIAHGLSMANDPDYRLGVEADRFAREYGDVFAESRGHGAQGNRRRALIEGALRLRAGSDTDAGRESTRREVERLLGVMRAEIDALRAPAPREYRYGAQNRPPGYGATPKDILRVDPPIHNIPQTRHGVAVYARPLTDEEVRGYELAPYVPLADIVARLLARVDRYGAKYAEQLRKGDTATLRSGLGSTIDAEPFFTDVPPGDLWGFVADALLAKYPATPVAPAPPPVAPVPVAPTGFGVEYPRDPTMYVPFPGDRSVDDGYKIDGHKVMFWATKAAAKAAASSLGWPLDSVTKVHTRFQVGWALADGRFGLVSREWLAKNLRPEIISGIYATAGLKR